jgi:outer membrane protein assembly factor BamB
MMRSDIAGGQQPVAGCAGGLRSTLLLLALAFSIACSSNSSKDDITKPMDLVDFEPTVSMDRLWSRDVGKGQGKKFNRLEAAIDGDMIFAVGADGELVALDRMSGDKLWAVDLDAEVTGGVGAAEGMLLVGTSSGRVFALYQDDGEEMWQSRVGGEVLAPPASDGEVVVVQTLNGKLVGLNAINGEKMWEYSSQLPVLTLRGTAAPVIEAGAVFAGFASGKLVSLDADSGIVRWEGRVALAQGESEIERVVDIDGRPLLLSNALYAVSYQGRIAAFDPANGRPLWYQEASSHVGLAEGFGNVYYADEKGALVAVDQDDGSLRWINEDLGYRNLSAPVAFNNYVAVADYEGYVHLLDQIDGKLVARVKVGSGGVRAPLLASGDVVYAYGNKGKLAAWQLRGSGDE